jgi:membrane protease YdiL (CAAX protease family)
MPTFADHVLVAVLVVLVPLWGSREYRRFVAAVEAGVTDARLREYRATIALEWGLVLVVLGVWGLHGRGLTALPPDLSRALLGLALTLAALAVLGLQWRAVRRLTPEGRDDLRRQVQPVQHLVPRTADESTWFRRLALTAGICEEVLYRGYLLWYLTPLLGAWPAVFVGALVFGLGHAYQGAAGVFKTSVVGALAGALYVGSGTLLWPIVLHAAIDLQAGAVARSLFGGGPDGTPAPAAGSQPLAAGRA